jgi:hypothetical protein
MRIGDNDPGFIEPDWLGAPMYWSSYDADTYLDMIGQADLTPVDAKIITDDEDGSQVRFLGYGQRKTRPENQNDQHTDRRRGYLLELWQTMIARRKAPDRSFLLRGPEGGR